MWIRGAAIGLLLVAAGVEIMGYYPEQRLFFVCEYHCDFLFLFSSLLPFFLVVTFWFGAAPREQREHTQCNGNGNARDNFFSFSGSTINQCGDGGLLTNLPLRGLFGIGGDFF